MTDDRATNTRGDNAGSDQHSSSATGASAAASSTGSPSSRSQTTNQTGDRQQNAATTGDRQRAIQTSSEQARGSGLARPQQSAAGAYGTGSPFSLMRRMAEDMDRLFEDFGFGLPGFALSPALSNPSLQRRGGSPNAFLQRGGWMPQIETFRRGDKLVLRADLPGLRKEDVDVEIEDGILTISGERSNDEVEDREGYYHSERSYGRFQRSLALPEGITGDNCEATFKDGVLEVTIPMPKQAERAAKKVQIR